MADAKAEELLRYARNLKEYCVEQESCKDCIFFTGNNFNSWCEIQAPTDWQLYSIAKKLEELNDGQ